MPSPTVRRLLLAGATLVAAACGGTSTRDARDTRSADASGAGAARDAAAPDIRVTADEVRRRMDAGETFAVVDARSAGAWSKSDVMAAGAVRIPPDDVAGHVAALAPGKSVVTYCT